MGEWDLRAKLCSRQSGIEMNVYHFQPAMVIYTPKEFPESKFKNKLGEGSFSAICFESQNFPDAPYN